MSKTNEQHRNVIDWVQRPDGTFLRGSLPSYPVVPVPIKKQKRKKTKRARTMLAGFCLLICFGCDPPADKIPRGGRMMPTPLQQEMLDRMGRIEKRLDVLENENARQLLNQQ